MTTNLKLLRKIWKKFYLGLRAGAVLVLWFLPLILFSVMVLVVSSWSTWWFILAAVLGTLQILLTSTMGTYIAASYVQKDWLKTWNSYEARWSESGLLMSKITEGLYHMVDFIYQEQIRKKEAMNTIMKDLGVDVDAESSVIPKGMEEFCKTAKF